jgi:hypothetical protein
LRAASLLELDFDDLRVTAEIALECAKVMIRLVCRLYAGEHG